MMFLVMLLFLFTLIAKCQLCDKILRKSVFFKEILCTLKLKSDIENSEKLVFYRGLI